MCKLEEAPGSFVLQSLRNPDIVKDIKRLEVSHGERTLGVRLALDGSDTDEYNFRLLQAKSLAKKIVMCPFTRPDAEIVHIQRWIPSVGYCLCVTQFDRSQ